MKNRDARCPHCCEFDDTLGVCKYYAPWGHQAMEEQGCTFYEFHKEYERRMGIKPLSDHFADASKTIKPKSEQAKGNIEQLTFDFI